MHAISLGAATSHLAESDSTAIGKDSIAAANEMFIVSFDSNICF